MASEPNEHVDDTLRDAFPVNAVAAARVASRALAGPRPRRTARWRASLAFATVVCCAGLAAWLSRPGVVPPPATPPAAIQLTGYLVDGVLVLPIPDDGIVIASPERRDRPREGSGIVIVEGDLR